MEITFNTITQAVLDNLRTLPHQQSEASRVAFEESLDDIHWLALAAFQFDPDIWEMDDAIEQVVANAELALAFRSNGVRPWEIGAYATARMTA
ncbi:hypothetical protein [Nocardioides sp. KR10-350]|uniref:hypothetical protein n=1 Tax=Nocardioides cheoyonin TaxID=3156615 RepID=UPI0032B4339A